MAFIRRRAAKEIKPARPTLKLVPPLEGAQLPPYSGERGTCGKCGSSSAGIAYYDAKRTCTHYNGPGPLVRWGQDRMHRSCRICGYPWDEEVPPHGEEEDGSDELPTQRQRDRPQGHAHDDQPPSRH